MCRRVCGRCDPFCQHAIGAKVHDTNTRATITYQVKKFTSLTCDTNGSFALWMSGHPANIYRLGTVVGDSVTTWASPTTIEDYSAMSSLYESFRIVSYGVRVYCSANPTESKGTLAFLTCDETPSTPNLTSEQYVEVLRSPLASADYTWIAKPTGPESNEWVPFTDTTGQNHTTLLLGGLGLTASKAFAAIEITVNYELIPFQGSSVARLATPAEKAIPLVETVAANTLASQPSASAIPQEQRSSNFWDFASTALKGLEQYGPLLLSMF